MVRRKQVNPESIYDLANSINNRSKKILCYLIENKNSYINSIHDSEYRWLLQNANLIVQGTTAKKGRTMITRDSCMAENVSWLLKSKPDSKIIVWAHNQHITKTSGRLGGFLAEKYGNAYYNIGFLSNSGTFSAFNISVTPNILEDSRPGSFEYSFHKTNIPIFFFDFHKPNIDIPQSRWLLKELNTRFVGSYVQKDSMIMADRLSKSFNAIIYLDSTHASNALN